MSKIRICIVEDDAEILHLTKAILELNERISVTRYYSNAESFIRDKKYVDEDIVLLDIGLPGVNGIELLKRVFSKSDPSTYVMYTTHFDTKEVFEALRAGAKGYILKGASPDRLTQDIFDIIDGGSPMSPIISRMVLESFCLGGSNVDHISDLSKQELEVLSGLEKGLTYKEIAMQKFVSPHTVRAQIRTIYEKLHVHSKIDAVKLFQKSHLSSLF
ncbi:MAG: response regulator transcription factor [Saprospiraceae bacterium]|jgi:DNA-binding NarL/FixJ family response regulator|nr:response regulator transcription factor [Saprospiraceae bacterium]